VLRPVAGRAAVPDHEGLDHARHFTGSPQP
jgi:hypothetical protein